MAKETTKIQVSSIRDSETSKSIGALVDLTFDERGRNIAASNLKWFPKSICQLEVVEDQNETFSKKYFITAPNWFLDKEKIEYGN